MSTKFFCRFNRAEAHRDKCQLDAGKIRLQRWPFTVDAATKLQDRPKPLFTNPCAANVTPAGSYRFKT